MPAPEPQSVVIVCPHCGTRYQVAHDAIGSGRLVQCANCLKAWQASPMAPAAAAPPRAVARLADEDKLFDSAAEAELDAAFAAEERAVAVPNLRAVPAAEPPDEPPPPVAAVLDRPDAETERRRQRAFSRRQSRLSRRLPLGRMRRALRIAGIGGLLILLVGGVAMRTEIVREVPDMAGIYEALGLAVNVVGLEFRDVRTLRALRDGADVMVVNARIVSASARPVPVPPVVVTLLDAAGNPVYEWSVTPDAADLEAGETVAFETRLTAAPQEAQRVRLSFATMREQVRAMDPSAQGPG